MTEPSTGSSAPTSGDADPATAGARAKGATAISRSELRKAVALVQHQLNNPLAALLAEVQLLGMEPALSVEQRAATLRITELTRRVIALVRDLEVDMDGAKRRPVGEPDQHSTRPAGG